MEETEKIRSIQKALPIYEYKDQLLKLIQENDFVTITGETGSGKSTQLPQYILDSLEIYNEIMSKTNVQEKSDKLKIVITQPRRVAAISMARRICYERQARLGEEVGYTIRFDDKTSSKTILKYVTDGILVRECLQDRDLLQYNVVVLDEAHERSLYTDILFALMKQAVIKRKGSLKLIITSATLDTDQFSKFFNNCPILKMKGRSYPVELKYGPSLANKRVDESVKAAIRMHLHEGPGDILVFLTGSEECEVARRLCLQKLQKLKDQGKEVPNMMIFTLYGAQNSDDQNQVFMKTPENCRKVTFSTNIAETSLTIDGVGFVIDCGYVKQKCYNPRTGMDSLIVVPISKVQAIQRQGRAGRTQPGKSYQLYSEKFFKEEMKEYTVPEILRVNLANVILDLKHMNINDVLNFDYMESPDRDAILQALKQLYLLDAIDEWGNITDLGREMCRFPLEPSYSKSLISAIIMGCTDEMITLVSILSSENIWSRPPRVKDQEYQEFEKVSREFVDIDGDHHTLLKIYRRWKRSGFSDQFCKQNFLNSRALKTAENIKVQLYDLIKNTNSDLCMKYYEKDPIYQIFKDSKKQDRDFLRRQKRHDLDQSEERDFLTPSDIFRMSLTTGFFFNSARKLHNNENLYLLIYPEGNVVEVDPQSIYNIIQEFPSTVVFTELGGNQVSKGVIRLISMIKQDWINSYISKIHHIDVFQLAGINLDTKQILISRNKQQREGDEDIDKKDKIDKINQAKERYQQRKKIKI